MKMNKKGITLVEVIVVLIIMAVLAGILVASYTGYIDKAKDDKALVEARAAFLAASTQYHEDYAEGKTTADDYDLDYAAVKKLAGVPGTISGAKFAEGKITELTYKTDKNTWMLEDGVWEKQ
jgi:prepilin-type N-terminal cleavage/methylation domain-containing protein